jgi:Fe-S cluster assembly protein SufD
LKSIEHKLSEVFSANFDIIGEGFPAHVNGARAGFMEDFMLSGLPSSHDERFLQSDMQTLFGAEEREIYFTPPRTVSHFGRISPAGHAAPGDISTAGYAAPEDISTAGGASRPEDISAAENAAPEVISADISEENTLIFENGFSAKTAIELPGGVFCGSIRAAFAGLPGQPLFHGEQSEAISSTEAREWPHGGRADKADGDNIQNEHNVRMISSTEAREWPQSAVGVPTGRADKADGDNTQNEHNVRMISSEPLTTYNSLADNKNDALTALNSAFIQDGALVWIPAGVRLAEPLLLDFRFVSDEEALMSFGRTLIVLGEGAEATISILYRTGENSMPTAAERPANTRFLIDFVREIVIGKGAKLHISECALMGEGSSLLLNSYMRQEANSHTDSVFASLGAGFSRISQQTDLAGEHSEANLHGLYIASDNAKSDIELRLNHLTPDCRSRQLVKGIATGQATGVFSGMVYVARDAQHTDAAQQNRNLQLSDAAQIFTRPQLEIYADDVKCGHGATIGRLDEEAIYYMRQRGVGENEARKMQMQGFADDIINHCPAGSFREFVAARAEGLIEKF